MYVKFQLNTKNLHVFAVSTLPPQFPGEFCVLLQMPLDFSSLQIQDELQFKIESRENNNIVISIKSQKATLHIENPDLWQLFLRTNITGFVEILVVMFLLPVSEDIFWVMQVKKNTALVLGAAQTDKTWEGTLTRREISANDFNFDHLLEDEVPRKEILDRLNKRFRNWVPANSPFKTNYASSKEHHLTIKIHPELSEFLSFPLSLFVSYKYDWFSKYVSIHRTKR